MAKFKFIKIKDELLNQEELDNENKELSNQFDYTNGKDLSSYKIESESKTREELIKEFIKNKDAFVTVNYTYEYIDENNEVKEATAKTSGSEKPDAVDLMRDSRFDLNVIDALANHLGNNGDSEYPDLKCFFIPYFEDEKCLICIDSNNRVRYIFDSEDGSIDQVSSEIMVGAVIDMSNLNIPLEYDEKNEEKITKDPDNKDKRNSAEFKKDYYIKEIIKFLKNSKDNLGSISSIGNTEYRQILVNIIKNTLETEVDNSWLENMMNSIDDRTKKIEGYTFDIKLYGREYELTIKKLNTVVIKTRSSIDLIDYSNAHLILEKFVESENDEFIKNEWFSKIVSLMDQLPDNLFKILGKSLTLNKTKDGKKFIKAENSIKIDDDTTIGINELLSKLLEPKADEWKEITNQSILKVLKTKELRINYYRLKNIFTQPVKPEEEKYIDEKDKKEKTRKVYIPTKEFETFKELFDYADEKSNSEVKEKKEKVEEVKKETETEKKFKAYLSKVTANKNYGNITDEQKEKLIKLILKSITVKDTDKVKEALLALPGIYLVLLANPEYKDCISLEVTDSNIIVRNLLEINKTFNKGVVITSKPLEDLAFKAEDIENLEAVIKNSEDGEVAYACFSYLDNKNDFEHDYVKTEDSILNKIKEGKAYIDCSEIIKEFNNNYPELDNLEYAECYIKDLSGNLLYTGKIYVNSITDELLSIYKKDIKKDKTDNEKLTKEERDFLARDIKNEKLSNEEKEELLLKQKEIKAFSTARYNNLIDKLFKNTSGLKKETLNKLKSGDYVISMDNVKNLKDDSYLFSESFEDDMIYIVDSKDGKVMDICYISKNEREDYISLAMEYLEKYTKVYSHTKFTDKELSIFKDYFKKVDFSMQVLRNIPEDKYKCILIGNYKGTPTVVFRQDAPKSKDIETEDDALNRTIKSQVKTKYVYPLKAATASNVLNNSDFDLSKYLNSREDDTSFGSLILAALEDFVASTNYSENTNETIFALDNIYNTSRNDILIKTKNEGSDDLVKYMYNTIKTRTADSDIVELTDDELNTYLEFGKQFDPAKAKDVEEKEIITDLINSVTSINFNKDTLRSIVDGNLRIYRSLIADLDGKATIILIADKANNIIDMYASNPINGAGGNIYSISDISDASVKQKSIEVINKFKDDSNLAEVIITLFAPEDNLIDTPDKFIVISNLIIKNIGSDLNKTLNYIISFYLNDDFTTRNLKFILDNNGTVVKETISSVIFKIKSEYYSYAYGKGLTHIMSDLVKNDQDKYIKVLDYFNNDLMPKKLKEEIDKYKVELDVKDSEGINYLTVKDAKDDTVVYKAKTEYVTLGDITHINYTVLVHFNDSKDGKSEDTIARKVKTAKVGTRLELPYAIWDKDGIDLIVKKLENEKHKFVVEDYKDNDGNWVILIQNDLNSITQLITIGNILGMKYTPRSGKDHQKYQEKFLADIKKFVSSEFINYESFKAPEVSEQSLESFKKAVEKSLEENPSESDEINSKLKTALYSVAENICNNQTVKRLLNKTTNYEFSFANNDDGTPNYKIIDYKNVWSNRVMFSVNLETKSIVSEEE